MAAENGGGLPGWVAAGVIGIALGAAGGFYGATWNAPVASASAPGGGPGGPGGGPPGMMGGPGGGGSGGGGGAQDHPNAARLLRVVGALTTMEKLRGNELSADQRQKLKAVATDLQGADTLTEEQCEAKLEAISGILSDGQDAVLEEMTARPGRGGGGGGGRAGGGPGGGTPGGYPGGPGGYPGGGPGGGSGGPPRLTPAAPPGMGGPGGGGGAQIDFERPFKEGRGKERLDELAGLLSK